MRGFTGPKRVLDSGQIFVAVMHELFVGLLGRQVGFEHIAAIECRGVGLCVALATSFFTAPWALARGWSVRYWFCLATWAWSVASFACRVSLTSWTRTGFRRSTYRIPSSVSTSANS